MGRREPPQRLRQLAGWAIAIALLAFIGQNIAASWEDLREADLSFDWPLLLLSMVLLALYMVGRALVWQYLTVMSGIAIALPHATAAWFYSQLGKYLPGKVFLYLGRLHFYTREGKPAGPVTLAFGVELVGTFAASIITVLVAILTFDAPSLAPYRWALLVALVVFLMLLNPSVLNRAIGIMARLLRRKPFEVALTYAQMLRFVGIYVLNWVVFGVALFTFINSFYAIETRSILYLAGAFSFASMMGMIAVFVPSGLGVREGILALFLGQVMPSPVALVSSVAARLWFTVVELLSIATVAALMKLAGLEYRRPPGGEELDTGLAP